jgi:hypothetical protein
LVSLAQKVGTPAGASRVGDFKRQGVEIARSQTQHRVRISKESATGNQCQGFSTRLTTANEEPKTCGLKTRRFFPLKQPQVLDKRIIASPNFSETAQNNEPGLISTESSHTKIQLAPGPSDCYRPHNLPRKLNPIRIFDANYQLSQKTTAVDVDKRTTRGVHFLNFSLDHGGSEQCDDAEFTR